MSSTPLIYFNPSASNESCKYAPAPGVLEFHKSLPNYSPTPLVPLTELAAELGVQAIFVKNESNRFGLPSFKVLGASWGCFRAVARHLGLSSDESLEKLASLAKKSPISLVTATEGNHGRAVAYIARLLGIRAQIFVPSSMNDSTRFLINSEGAHVSVVQGTYDNAVAAAWENSKEKDVLLIQDTAFEGYEDVPAWIVEGYSTMMREVEEQISLLSLSASMVVTPVGVGSLAHAVTRHCKSRCVSVVTVEPDSASCLLSSLHAGKRTPVPTSTTIMDGMNCGTVSSTAWPDLQRFVDVGVSVSSYESHCAVEYLASNSVAAGPCGGASLAALHRIAKEEPQVIGENSVIILLSTEGTREYQIPHE